VALDSRARSRFQASYINRLEDDSLSANVKGTAIWRTDPGRQTEGYYVFSPKLNEYQAIHYIEEDQLWAFVACDEQYKWYTIKPVPKILGLGPTLTPIQAIDVDPPEDTTTRPLTPTTITTKPLTPVTLTSHTTTTNVPTQPIQSTMSQAGTSTTTLPTTTIPTGGGGGGGGIPAPPPGGGRGGGGGGATGGPPPANGRLEGNPPFEFTGDRERSKAFMLAFQIYQGMNPNADVITNPYQ